MSLTILKSHVPTNDQIREEVLENVNYSSDTNSYWCNIQEEFLRLQFHYFPVFCEDTREQNIRRERFHNEAGNITPTRYVAGKTYQGTTGWSKDKTFKDKWVVSDQLFHFMRHIHSDFWIDINKKVRDSFMNGVLRGDDSMLLLDKVYLYYGSNVTDVVIKEDLETANIPQSVCN